MLTTTLSILRLYKGLTDLLPQYRIILLIDSLVSRLRKLLSNRFHSLLLDKINLNLLISVHNVYLIVDNRNLFHVLFFIQLALLQLIIISNSWYCMLQFWYLNCKCCIEQNFEAKFKTIFTAQILFLLWQTLCKYVMWNENSFYFY